MCERVVAAAEGWIGTPYVHQAAVRQGGCDCLGLILGLWREVHGEMPEVVPPYSMDWSEPQGQEALWQAARRHLQAKPPGDAAAGDVLLFRMRDGAVAKHLGVQVASGGAAAFIHAYARRGVVRSALSQPWRRRLVARFEFPAGDG
jgi:NlpC/P60 family putative phage cell wall peptidase